MKLTQVFLIFTIIVAGALASAPSRERRQAVQRCPDICTAQYDPVCASNNRCIRVFSNSCQLGIANCNLKPNEQYKVVPKHYCNNFNSPSFNRCLKIKE